MRSILPKAPEPPNVRLSEKCLLIYSLPGVGKTHLGSLFPKALFLPTEPGTEEMTVAACPEIRDWQTFMMYVDAIGREEHSYETIVVDTVGALYAMCHEHVCKLNGWADVDDGAHGRGWRKVKDAWTVGMNKLRTVKRADGRALCVVLLDHERSAEITIQRGSKTIATGRMAVTSALPGAGRKILHGMVQQIWRLSVGQDGERMLRTQPLTGEGSADVEAKSRGPRGKSLPDEISLGSEGEGFRRIATAWSRAFGGADAQGWAPRKKSNDAEQAGEDEA